MNYLIRSSGVISLSGSNFGKRFLGCFGSECCAPGTATASATNHILFVAMVAINLKFDLGDVGVAPIVLFLGGSGGPEPPSSASGRS